ncbi:probable elongator complex protein 2 [Lucilia cuprina]|uniref:probable elongator complex protein 2 n=1 Tax=Lucilia cuprina TaxID=7375 RepID=UPI001F053C7B|nr:probable elongator complex protein 2 [Lucilia cuprina]
MSVENIYTSIGCNRTTESADWGNNGLIVFGACNAVAIYDPQFKQYSAKITHTYVRHTKRVNTVRWLKSQQQDKEMYCLSGSDDKLAILWNVENLDEIKSYELKGHESGVNAVDGLQRSNGEWLLATAAADSTIKLWYFGSNDVEPICKQTLHLNTGFCFTLRLTLLPKSEQILLAFTADDESVALWAEDIAQLVSDEFNFQPVHKLLGHEDWVRGLDFVREGDDLLLASSSQDNFIRLWRIAPRTAEQVLNNKVDIFNLLDEATGEIRVEEKILQLSGDSWYAISLESVLYGHDNWVYGVNWYKSNEQTLSILSASIDKTLIIWQPSEESGIWMEKVRLGEVGGNSLGFFGGKFSSDGKSVLGHSYQGGFHIWKQSEDNEALWLPQVNVGGHFGEVRDLAWEPQGEYVMSVSADQTTRIHSPWRHDAETWHELARPQVHGYDMQALALLSRYKFASGAEEKIVRTFQASANFIENFRRITKVEEDKEGDQLLESLPKGASVPSLGLSNKAVYTLENPANEERHVKDEYPENYFIPITLNAPPQEETLMQNTLWPEVQKLYGHGYEIYALASSPDATLLASSCKSSNAEHAQIILWNTATWKQIQKLSGHQLTVTQMSFSPNGEYLLSVSRDRRWSLFKRQPLEKDKVASFALTACTDKTNGVHTRIIWSCDWSHDSKYFVTSSREGKVVIWCKTQDAETKETSLNGWKSLDVLELKNESITAVTFAHSLHENGAYVLALGCESGLIHVYQFKDKFTLLLTLNKSQSHHLTVKRLQFRPCCGDNKQFQLASCGEDYLVRVYQLNL